MRCSWLIFAVAAFCVACGAVAADPQGGMVLAKAGDTNRSTVITSEKLTFDYQKKYAVFEKDVRVVDGDMSLTADKLAIWFDDQDEINLIKAEGNVHITQQDKTANAGEAVYEVPTGKIVLTVNPRLQRGRHYLEGDKISYWRDKDLLVVEPQPRLVIYPDDEGGGGEMNLFGD